MTTEESHQHLKDIDAQTTEEELIEIYKSWSNTYDKDVTEDLAYVAPKFAVEKLCEILEQRGASKDSLEVLDFGCGTGLVGEQLYQRGLRNVDGVDISKALMKIAEEKRVYKGLICGYMASENCKDLGVDENSYDIATCVGVFTIGHVKGKGFDDLVHVVKPGGLACFTIRDCVADDPQYGYSAKMNKLCEEKKWRLNHIKKSSQAGYSPGDLTFVFQPISAEKGLSG